MKHTSNARAATTTLSHVWCWHDTPVGRLSLTASGAGLASVGLPPPCERDWALPPPGTVPDAWREAEAVLAAARQQLDEYFAGRRRVFTLSLDAQGTPFQRRVWEIVAAIPYGSTRTYGEVAAQLGQPAAMRAVGAANGHNPLPIIIPCHRVVGRGGRLVGYGGGLALKQALLVQEGALLV